MPLQLATEYLEGNKYVPFSGILPIIKKLGTKFAPCKEDSHTLSFQGEDLESIA